MDVWPGTGDAAWDRVQEELHAAGLTDGLPVVPPTADRVGAMLAAHGFDPDDVVTEMLAPMCVPVTWKDVAINAVMAGCLPAHLPVVGAAVDGISAPEFNLIGISTTTGSACPLVIVNGPVVQALGMNAEGNALGPGNRANATIGRALSLCLRNAGGAKPGETDMATLGQPGKYTFCFAENEAASPWEPLHVERGFKPTDSVVTVVGVSGSVEIVDSCSRTRGDLAQSIAQSMLIAGSCSGTGVLGGGEPLILLPPEIATAFHGDGCSKLDAKQAIFERAEMPAGRLSPAVLEQMKVRWDASGIDVAKHVIRVAERAADVMLVVAGGIGIKTAYVPTWSGSTKAVSRIVPGRRP